MSIRTLSRLMMTAALAVCAPALPGTAAAQATTTAFEGFNPDDPFGSGARELIRLVRRQCAIPDDRIVVGVASETAENQQLTKDQSNNIMLQVHKGFTGIENVGVVNFSDVGALDDLNRAGLLNTAAAGDVQQNVGKADVVIRSSAYKSGRALRLVLKATHTRINGCEIPLTPMEIPSRLIGEVFLPPEVIFGRLARSMWQQTSDRKFYMYRDGASGATRDPQITEYFATLTRSAVASAKDENADLRGKSLIPVSAVTDPERKANTWVVGASLLPFGNGYRLQLDAELPEEKHVAQEGLIVASDLPSVRRGDLVRQASMIRSAPARTAPGAPAVTRNEGDAAVISISNVPLRVQDTLDDRNQEQRYAFQLFRESFVEFDVVSVGAPDTAFKPELFGSNGMPVDSLPPGRARVNLRRYRLPAGQYELRVAAQTRGKHQYVLNARAASASSMLEFEPTGRLTRRFQDWFAGERQIGRTRTRTCFAYTQAVEVAPTGWREQRPYIWIVINDDPKVKEIAHFIDDASRYDAKTAVTAQFEDQNGSLRPLNVQAAGGMLLPAVTNGKGEIILDRESVRGYTQGASILLEGRTAEGKPAKVRYSLLGYRSAVNAAALNCGRPDLAQDLVWRR